MSRLRGEVDKITLYIHLKHSEMVFCTLFYIIEIWNGEYVSSLTQRTVGVDGWTPLMNVEKIAMDREKWVYKNLEKYRKVVAFFKDLVYNIVICKYA